jgi:hypothetical protein
MRNHVFYNVVYSMIELLNFYPLPNQNVISLYSFLHDHIYILFYRMAGMIENLSYMM